MTEADRVRPHAIQVVAHRGASEDAPEHTLAAYRKAIEDGADALECDVRLTADGHLVCVHDRRVDRTSNGRGAVSALELSELAALDFGSWKRREPERGADAPGWEESPDWYGTAGQENGGGEEDGEEDRDEDEDGERNEDGKRNGSRCGDRNEDRDEDRDEDRNDTSVLTLERLLGLIADSGRRIELAIETKHPTRWAGQVERTLLATLRRFGLDRPYPTGAGGDGTDGRDGVPHLGPGAEVWPVRIMSFSARSLQRIRVASPYMPTVYLLRFPRHREGRLPPGVHIAGPSLRVVRSRPEYVARLKAAGHQVHVWTVNEPEDVDLCVRLGVDAIITNRPRQVLHRLSKQGMRGAKKEKGESGSNGM